MVVRRALAWVWAQIAGFFTRLWAVITGATLSDVLPPSIVSTLRFLLDSLPRSMGFTDSAGRHLTGVVVFSIFLVIASFTLLTWLAVFWALVFGSLAILRLFPAIEARWPLTEADWPLWDVQ